MGPLGRSDVVDSAAVQDLLDRRAAAVLTRDATAWAATLSGPDGPLRTRQLAEFAAITAVAPTRWAYRLLAAEPAPGSTGAELLRVTVRLGYRLRPDRADVIRDQALTVRRGPDGWVVVATGNDGAGTPPHGRDLWELGPVRVTTGSCGIVVRAAPATGPAVAPDDTGLAGTVDAAAAEVDGVWGTDWPRQVVVLVPADVDQLATLLGRVGAGPERTTGLDQLAALTVGEAVTVGEGSTGAREGPTGAGEPVLRVVVNPQAFSRLTPTGRLVVLTHELTHVATRSQTRVAPALWLQEGYADYVGYRRSGLSGPQITAALVARLQAGAGPTGLPPDRAYDPRTGDLALVYAQSWTAAVLLARELGGAAGLTAFYRTAAGIPARSVGPPGWSTPAQDFDQAQSAAFRRTPDGVLDRFVQRWLRALPELVRAAP